MPFQFRGRFSEGPPPTSIWLDPVRRRRGGARSLPAGAFTCCVQKRVVDIRFGAAAGFLVAGAGDLPGGSPRGHAPAALGWLLRVSVEQSWTRTGSVRPGSTGYSSDSLIPAHPQPRTRPMLAADLATLLLPAASPPTLPALLPRAPPLTAQLVSDAAGELLSYLAPSSRCSRQTGGTAKRKENRRANEISFQVNEGFTSGVWEPGANLVSGRGRLCFQQVRKPAET